MIEFMTSWLVKQPRVHASQSEIER